MIILLQYVLYKARRNSHIYNVWVSVQLIHRPAVSCTNTQTIIQALVIFLKCDDDSFSLVDIPGVDDIQEANS